MVRMRLDQAMVERGLVQSRARARDAILRGHVHLNGHPALKASAATRSKDEIRLNDPASQYVSRAALKLKHGLKEFGFSPEGHNCMDIGASTGGFTQVLLEYGAANVFAFDVGHEQMNESIANNPSVVNREGLNAKSITADDLPFPISFMVSDVSFISLRSALPACLALAQPGTICLFLIKPQFEVGKGNLGKGGIVADPELGLASAVNIAHWLAQEYNCDIQGPIKSPISGGDGNQEYLVGGILGSHSETENT